MLGPSPSFSIDANELNPTGYSYEFCYSCNITPFGLPMITYAKDFITISALSVCKSSFIDASLAPITIIYNSAIPTTILATSYSDIFIDTYQKNCIFTDCKLFEPSCTTQLATQTNVIIDTVSPYSLTAV